MAIAWTRTVAEVKTWSTDIVMAMPKVIARDTATAMASPGYSLMHSHSSSYG
jgi:hypothetical protein